MSCFELLSAVRMAFDTIRAHKMRSLLTVLGVIIGTGTVVAVGSIITGVDSAVVNIMRSFGPETGFAFKYNMGFGRVTSEEHLRKPLTWEDAQAIAERCPSVVQVSPMLLSPGGMDRVRYKGNDLYNIEFYGADESYISAPSERMKDGRFFTDMESRRRVPVVVVGEDLAKAVFSTENPLGKKMDVNGHQFEVIGVLARPSASFP